MLHRLFRFRNHHASLPSQEQAFAHRVCGRRHTGAYRVLIDTALLRTRQRARGARSSARPARCAVEFCKPVVPAEALRAPPPGPAAAPPLPLPPTNILSLLNEISEDPHEGANAAAGIGWPEQALSAAETSQGSASANAQPLDTPYILKLMQTIHENDLHDGPELDALVEQIEKEGKRISQHSATAPDVPRLLQAIHEKNSAQGAALAALVEQIESTEHSERSESPERESATALPNPDIHILLQEIRERLPAEQATALAELVERSERPSPDRKTTCFPVFRRARP
ncbi:type III effector protein XopY [Xanthomonas graminis]|jgi:hypothetical protein|nr:type III effector protein XopY [Xanthomonas translucens]UKE53618.1 type III effector protein XopY [Xanthomonas translucens pv. graminis]WIH13308.1 type III effector protein XopY [Xanthomonas translucens pv. graminis]WIH16905.1 type III effector protein XopY [Xanthomonas translucens pv. graminis]